MYVCVCVCTWVKEVRRLHDKGVFVACVGLCTAFGTVRHARHGRPSGPCALALCSSRVHDCLSRCVWPQLNISTLMGGGGGGGAGPTADELQVRRGRVRVAAAHTQQAKRGRRSSL
jgi:hypothetical protein